MSDQDDGPTVAELVPVGGSWGGLLFDNPTIDLLPALIWTFTFDYAEVVRDYGAVTPSLTVDWIPLPRCSWRRMAGLNASAAAFAEPIESSVYFFQHHRYQAAEIRVADQRGLDTSVVACVYGDIDGLGIPSLSAEGWLRFGGILVRLSERIGGSDEARARLEEFTDTTGLVRSPNPMGFDFVAPSA